MTANTATLATTTGVPTGVVPSGVSGVTAVPIPCYYNQTTGQYEPIEGANGASNVAVTSLPALAAGTNVIGHVDVDSLPSLPAGTNAIGTVGVTSLPALPAGSNTIGTVDVGTMPSVVLGTGTSAIGTVDVTALPALPAGTNMIGHVDVDTLPAVTLGTDSVGLAKDATLTGGNAKVQVTAIPSIPAGTNQIGHVVVDTQPLPSSPLAAANKVTCSATDANVAPTGGFKHISIKNLDATNELIVTIDESSTASPTKPIYLEAGESFDDYISGSTLHYSASTGSPVLKYVLR